MSALLVIVIVKNIANLSLRHFYYFLLINLIVFLLYFDFKFECLQLCLVLSN